MAQEKKNEPRFLRSLLILSVVSFVIASYPVLEYLNVLQTYSILSGYFVALLNALIGYRLNNLSVNKPVKVFMALVFGGMGIRVLISAILLIVLLKIVNLDDVTLLGSAFFFYFLFITAEIYYFHKLQTGLKADNLSPDT